MKSRLFFIIYLCKIITIIFGNHEPQLQPQIKLPLSTIPSKFNKVDDLLDNGVTIADKLQPDISTFRLKRNALRHSGESGFIRLGRASGQNPSKNSFLRFGKSDKSFLRFGKSDKSFLRFGRNDPARSERGYIRFGRNGRSEKSFLRFGRSNTIASNINNEPMKFGRRGDKFIRFGRSDKNEIHDQDPLQHQYQQQKNFINEALIDNSLDDSSIDDSSDERQRKLMSLIRLVRPDKGFIRLGKKLFIKKRHEEYENKLTPGIGKRELPGADIDDDENLGDNFTNNHEKNENITDEELIKVFLNQDIPPLEEEHELLVLFNNRKLPENIKDDGDVSYAENEDLTSTTSSMDDN